jgi:hypothetical protein
VTWTFTTDFGRWWLPRVMLYHGILLKLHREFLFLGFPGCSVRMAVYKAVVPKLFYKAGLLLTLALVLGHIKCSFAIYYTQVALEVKTTLKNKLGLY